MSVATCHICGEVYDTDFEMETNHEGHMICDKCYEKEEEIAENIIGAIRSYLAHNQSRPVIDQP